MTLDGKGSKELLEAFNFLTVWPEYLRSRYGELNSLTHLSNPDDPPDVIAHFSKCSVNIEITSIEPPHIMQSERLHNQLGGGARSEMPLSRIPANTQDAKEIMYIPGNQKAWELVADRCDVRYKMIVERGRRKFSNPKIKTLSSGILLFHGETFGDKFEHQAIEKAFKALQQIPVCRGWIIALIHRWNSLAYYTAIHSDDVGFRFEHQEGG